MKFRRRSIGVLKVFLSLIWIGLVILLLIYGLRGIAWLEAQAELTLEAVIENVGLVKTLMTEITDVMDEVDLSLSTVENSMIDGSLILKESLPMVDNTSQLIVEDVPQAMDDIQSSLPAVIEAARTIEKTLALLSGFKFIIPIPLASDFQFDLGVDYDPEISLEESLANLSSSLQDIPDQMRVMEGDFVSADISMTVMSENLLDVAYSLDKVREQFAEINPVIDSMVTSLEGIQGSLGTTQTQLPILLQTARSVIILLSALLFISQLPPIYSGFQLLEAQEAEEQKELLTENGSS